MTVSLKFTLLKSYILLRNCFRMNHWRGHGIHSPFMYRLVREVIVRENPRKTGRPLPESIAARLLSERDAAFLRNLYGYLDYPRCIVAGEETPENRTLCIASADVSPEAIGQLIGRIRNDHDECCVAVLGINKSYDKYRLCKKLIREENCVSVDLYRTCLFIYDARLRKQHYRLRG